MENPLKSFTQKDWLYIGGAVASIVALSFVIWNRNLTNPGPGVQTDVPNAAPPIDASTGVNYLNYNVGAYDAPIVSGPDLSPNPANTPAGSCCQSDCAGPSPLATGDTFSGLNSLLTFYQNTNPVYVQLQQIALERYKVDRQNYAAYFATGESYSRGGIALGVSDQG